MSAATPLATRAARGGLLTRTLLPLGLALVIAGALLLALGVNPLAFAADTLRFGLLDGAWQRSAARMAPLLLIALGLIVVFRAGLWNLGGDGQFLLGAVMVAGVGPGLLTAVPGVLGWALLAALAMATAAAWGVIPALLRTRFGITEIVTSLMLSLIAVGIVNLLILGVFHGDAAGVPETNAIPTAQLLPYLPGTSVHVGVLVALVVMIAGHLVLTRTAVGMRIDVLGASPRAARFAGIGVTGLTIGLFLVSGTLIGLGAALDTLGTQGYLRAHTNPAFASAILPFVFLARLRPLAAIPFVAFYAVVEVGGTIAATRAGLSADILLVFVALLLVCLTVVDHVAARRALGRPVVPEELRALWARRSQRSREEVHDD